MPTINQLVRNPRKAKIRKVKTPALQACPKKKKRKNACYDNYRNQTLRCEKIARVRLTKWF